MAISVSHELHVFLLSLAVGALAGVFFDIFRAFRRLIRSGVLWVGIQDLLYWLLCAIAAFFFLYRTNYGQPRWYIFFGILQGALFYHLLLRDRMVHFFLFLCHVLHKILSFLFRILFFPFRLIYRIFRPVFSLFYRFFGKIGRFFALRTRKALGWSRKSVKNFKKRVKMY